MSKDEIYQLSRQVFNNDMVVNDENQVTIDLDFDTWYEWFWNPNKNKKQYTHFQFSIRLDAKDTDIESWFELMTPLFGN